MTLSSRERFCRRDTSYREPIQDLGFLLLLFFPASALGARRRPRTPRAPGRSSSSGLLPWSAAGVDTRAVADDGILPLPCNTKGQL